MKKPEVRHVTIVRDPKNVVKVEKFHQGTGRYSDHEAAGIPP